MHSQAGPSAGNPLAFFPDFSRPIAAENVWALPVLAFLVNIGVQWWAFWYPGAEPGGGGYIAQRIFSAKDERNGLLSVLWFNIAHYAVRPWPWILTALAAIVLYPNLQHPERSRAQSLCIPHHPETLARHRRQTRSYARPGSPRTSKGSRRRPCRPQDRQCSLQW